MELHNHLHSLLPRHLSQNSPHSHRPVSMMQAFLKLLRFVYSPASLRLELSLQTSWCLSSKSSSPPQIHHPHSSPRQAGQHHGKRLIKLQLKRPLLLGSLHTYLLRSRHNCYLVDLSVFQQMRGLHLHQRHLY